MEMDGDDTRFDGRVAELALLNSMYPHQLRCDDSVIQEAVESENCSTNIDHSIEGVFSVDKCLEVYFSLPTDYPDKSVFTHCRLVDELLSKNDRSVLLNELNKTTLELLSGENVNLINFVQKVEQAWKQLDQSKFEVKKVDQTNEHKPTDKQEDKEICRFWIYSHHIYSATKRKLIINLSDKLKLTGFMLIGKPGFICVEGTRTDCDSFWCQIRSLSWQKISLIDTEMLQDKSTVFKSFEELADRSKVFSALEANKCDTILKQFLGFSK